VRDNGGGIAELDRPRVYERFYKGRGVGGTGLGIGLFISRAIVDRLGGTLSFECDAGGTEFTLKVPAEGTSQASVNAAGGSRTPSETKAGEGR
jgi:signal transduction histidine kinase